MRRHNRATMLLLLPLIIAVWLIGWSLYWIGSARERKQHWNITVEPELYTYEQFLKDTER
jgi:hypothetical protein